MCLCGESSPPPHQPRLVLLQIPTKCRLGGWFDARDEEYNIGM